jgi:hypothetical protein
MRPGFSEMPGREVHGDDTAGKTEAGVLDGAPDAFACLLDRGVG